MTTSPTSEQLWEQPRFDNREPGPHLTGPVLLPVGIRADVPPPGLEEQRLRAIRGWIWPLALVIAIVTGSGWTFLALPLIVGFVCRRRLRELRRQRYAGVRVLGEFR